MNQSEKLTAFQAKCAADAAAALKDPALLAIVAHAISPLIARSLREREPEGVSEELAKTVYEIGPLRIDTSEYQAYLDGKPITLTPREFMLLATLARRPGQVFTREQLLELAWPENIRERIHDDRTVDVHVRRVRAAFERETSSGAPQVLQTIHGVGYRLNRALVSLSTRPEGTAA